MSIDNIMAKETAEELVGSLYMLVQATAEGSRLKASLDDLKEFVANNPAPTGVEVWPITVHSSDSDALDVTNARIIRANASGGSIVIGGFSGGVEGQIITILKSVTTNTVTLEHNETSGDQKIQAPGAVDYVISNYGGVDLIFDGTDWTIIDKA